MSKTLYTNISELITNRGVMKKGGVQVVEEDLGIIRDGALLWDSAKGILWMGYNDDIPKSLIKGSKKISLNGKVLSPALVDCHTHLVFGGNRYTELGKKLRGLTYQQIALEGGGIKSTVTATRSAKESELFNSAKSKIQQMQKLGVGILEIKSGYGLDWESEKKCLKVIKKIKAEFEKKIIIQSTFLGAHDFPPEAKGGRDKVSYFNDVIEKMLPKIKAEKLADACDIFCDDGYFTTAQSRRLLRRAATLGLEIKIHADELADTGGAALAADLGCLSADHLLKINDAGIVKMAKRGVVAVLLPGTAFYLRMKYAPVDKMRKAGVCLALSTDYNPGTSPTFNLPFIMSLACLQMGMTTAESFAAVTYGGARALGLHGTHGFLRVGAKPKMAIFNIPTYVGLISEFAHPGLCDAII